MTAAGPSKGGQFIGRLFRLRRGLGGDRGLDKKVSTVIWIWRD
ncbi:hypothetical protein AYX14_07145 [Cryptococcus neoformans]|nr:hypothetical protein AYX14_07145 [Cryptococcus neoformans var. grubii]